jgi:hypothetical protein
MKKEWKIVIGITTVLIFTCVMCLCISSLISFYRTEKEAKTPACPPLPKNFTESELVGTWIGNYFGNVDKLTIRADGTYKQNYSGDYINFESDWQKWHVEYDKDGYARLHLAGMRRCDGLDSECNDPGGGLPSDSPAVNPCTPEWIALNDEVILFVTGTTSDAPLGIILRQARLAGSDWTYTFRLEK